MEKYENIQKLVTEMGKDVNSFYVKGNASAGTRVRKRMMELKGLAQDLRVHIQSVKNDRCETKGKGGGSEDAVDTPAPESTDAPAPAKTKTKSSKRSSKTPKESTTATPAPTATDAPAPKKSTRSKKTKSTEPVAPAAS